MYPTKPSLHLLVSVKLKIESFDPGCQRATLIKGMFGGVVQWKDKGSTYLLISIRIHNSTKRRLDISIVIVFGDRML